MINEEHLSSPKERGKRLRLLRKMCGLSLSEFSKKYGIGISTIKYWECAQHRGLSIGGAKKIVNNTQQEGVQCSYEWLMHGIGPRPRFFEIKLGKKLYPESVETKFNDWNKDNEERILYEEENSLVSEISLFCEKIIDAITISVFDDGMEPIYLVGDNIGGKRLYGNNLLKAIGKNCIIETADRSILCRRVAHGSDKNRFDLYSMNPTTLASPPHLYNIEILSAAPITRVWRRF